MEYPPRFHLSSPLKNKKSLTCWVTQTKARSLSPPAAITWEVEVELSAQAVRESFKWAPGSWIGSRGGTLRGGRIWKPCSVKHEWKKLRISLEKRKRRENLRSEEVLNGRRMSVLHGPQKSPERDRCSQRASKVPA